MANCYHYGFSASIADLSPDKTILHVGVPLEADPVPVGAPGHDLDPADVGGHPGLHSLVLQVQGVRRGVCYCQPGYSGVGGSCENKNSHRAL